MTAIGGDNMPGIGQMYYNNVSYRSATEKIIVGDGVNGNPKVVALSGKYVDDGNINSSATIGFGAVPIDPANRTRFTKVELTINSGVLYAIDRACVYNGALSPYTKVIGGQTAGNDVITVSGGSLRMYGNATFNSNFIVKSGGAIYIGGTPPTVNDLSGKAIAMPTGFKTTIRNFDNKPLSIEEKSKVIVDEKSGILLGEEADGLLSSRGILAKFNVPFTYDANLQTARSSKFSEIVISRAKFDYEATISPIHPVAYGASKRNDIDSVTNWVTTNNNSSQVVITGLSENVNYYTFAKLKENKYFTGTAVATGSVPVKIVHTPKRKTFTLRLMNSEGGGLSKVYKIKEDAKFTLPADIFTRNGYYIYKWSVNKNGTGRSYKAGYTFTKYINQNTTFYAVWRSNKSLFSNESGSFYNTGIANSAANSISMVLIVILILLNICAAFALVALKK